MTLRQLPRRRPAPDDDGAALIMALVFVTAIGLVVGALLSYGAANVRAATAMRERAQADYDVDGALQTAVNTIRTSSYNNAPGQQCFDGSGTFTYSGDVAVACTPKPGTGGAGGQAPINDDNKPPYALLTLQKGPFQDQSIESGINVAGNVRVHGKVHSNWGIYINPPPFTLACPGLFNFPCSQLSQDSATGSVRADWCFWPDAVISAGTRTCSSTTTVNDPGAAGEPNASAYAQPAVPADAIVFTVENTPKCNSGTASTVSLSPGVYTDSEPLEALTDGHCTAKVIHFTPGVYFFDFRNGEPGHPDDGNREWVIDDAATTVVGGTPNGWSPNAPTKPVLTVPGSCVSPLASSNPGTGVQFVFGGDSRLRINEGRVELCGQWHSGKPPIAIYGAKEATGPATGTGVVNVADSTSTTTPAFAPIANLVPDDGDAAATATISSSSNRTARLTARGFIPAPAPAKGSVLQSATLRIRERIRSGGSGSVDTWKATASPGGEIDLPETRSDSYRVKTTDLLATLDDRVANGTFTGLTVTFEATANRFPAPSNLRFDVESVTLELTWLPPQGIRSQATEIDGSANCISKEPYPLLGSCAVLKTEADSDLRLSIAGTTYTPLAALDIHLPSRSMEVFRVGVIARMLRLGQPPAPQNDTTAKAVISTPENVAATSDLVVHLTAYVCRAGPATCGTYSAGAPNWTSAGQAKVSYGGTSRRVTVQSWRIMR